MALMKFLSLQHSFPLSKRIKRRLFSHILASSAFKQWVRVSTLSLLLFILATGLVNAAAITSTGSGNWSASAWPNTGRTGTITTSTVSTTVTGVGTLFLTQISVGNIIKTTGNVVIGTVASITNNTTLVLTGNAASNNAGINFNFQGVGPGDDATIAAGNVVTVDVSSVCNSLTVGNGSTITVSPTFILTVTNALTFPNLGAANATGTISGTGTLNAGSMAIGGTTAPVTAQTVIVTSTITALNITGNLTLTSLRPVLLANNPTFQLQTGTVTVSGTLACVTTNNATSTTTVTLATGAQTGYLKLASAPPTSTSGNAGVSTFTFNGTGATVDYSGAAQTVLPLTYTNLTLSGSGVKTTTGVTVNGILSMEGTATASVSVTYGAAATLQYNTATPRTASTVEWITPFVATGGVIIKNTGAITSPGALQMGNNTNVPLNINSGATLTAAGLITLHGDFINAGTFTSAIGIAIAGTVATQSIAGFTTSGDVSMTKTAGTATFQGNVNSGTLTTNGVGGTLNLGVGLTHTLTGSWTRTNGTLNGGSSTLQVGTSIVGVGGAFTANAGTIEWNAAGPQTLVALAYFNLTLSNSGNKTFPSAITITGNLSITGTATAILGTGLVHSANSLTLGGLSQPSGSWGGTGSAATHINSTYFTATTGIVNIGACANGIWTGATSTNWNTTTNWCNNTIPTAAIDVFISTGVPNQPTIGAAAVCRNISLGSGATLTISGANTLAVSGNWTNNGGTLIPNTSTVTFNAASQTIGGTSATTFNNVTYSGTTLASVSSAISLSGNLTVSSGTFASSSTVTFTGSAPQTISGAGATSFTNVTYSGSSTATASSAISISGDLTVSSGTFASSNTVTFNGSNSSTAQSLSGAGIMTFTNVTLNTTNSANVGVNSSISISGTLTFSAAGLLVVNSSSNITLGNAATIAGAASDRYIQLDGSTGTNSNLIVTTTATTTRWAMNYPIGTSSGGYTPVNIPTVSTAPVANATLSIKAIYNLSSQGQLRRVFRFVVAGNANATTFTNGAFNYNNATDISAGDAESNYVVEWFLNASSASAAWTNIGASTHPPNNIFTVAAAEPLTTGTYYYTNGSADAYPNTWYSYQTGVWSNWQNWTTDPSGSSLVNGLNLPPQPGDAIVILNGTTITNDVNGQVATTTIINSGGTLDMSTTTGNTLGTVSGAGLLRINGATLPTGTYTSFVSSTGGTIEYYNTGGTVSATQTTYNNLKFSNSTGSNIVFITATNPTTLTINGTLNISATSTGTVTWQINGNGGAYNVQQVITIAGDVTVSSNGKITAGTGRAGASATQHSLTLSGNLTNNGVVQFFDPTQAPFTSDPRTLAVWTAALQGNAVNVTFSGASDATVTCNGQTDFYRFILNKGTGQQAMLTVNSSSTSNFRFYGPSNLDADVSSGNTALYIPQNALSIVNGTLQLTGSIDIPVLEVNSNASGNGYTPIPINGALWLNGANVTVQMSDNSQGGTKDGRIMISGLLRVTAGTINNGFGKGIGSQNGGTYWQEGGTVNCWQFRPKASGSGIFSFIQSGGTLNVGYGFELSGGLIDTNETSFCRFDLASVNSTFQMSGSAILNVAKPTQNAPINGTYPGGGLFHVGSSTANYNVTGGTVNLYMGMETSVNSFPGYITSTAPLYNVNIYEESNTVQTAQLLTNDLVVLNDLTINKGGALAGTMTAGSSSLSGMTAGTYEYVSATSGGSGTGAKFTIVVGSATAITSVTLNAGSSGYVVGDVFTFAGSLFGGAGTATFSITAANVASAPTLVTGTLNVTVGRNFSIQNGAIFTPGTGAITFNGSGAQTWAYGDSPSATSPSITSLGTVVVNKSAGTLSLSFPNTTFTTLPSTNVLPSIGTLTLTSGTFNDGGSTVTVSGTLTNNATHSSSGSGSITYSGTTAIGGNNGTFGNLIITAANSTIATSGNQTVTGNLQLNGATSSILNIGSNSLTVNGTISSTVGLSNKSFIQTSGFHNAGGLTRPCVANTDLTFPVGSGPAYTPNTINIPAASATTFGTITVRPVNSEHPNVTTTNSSLKYYWRVTSSGFVFAASPTITHKNYNFQSLGLTGTLTAGASTTAGMTTGTFNLVSAASGGSGGGAKFTVVVGSATTITSVTVSSSGVGYLAGDAITFNGNQFGAGSGSATFNVAAGNVIASAASYQAARYDRTLNKWGTNNTPTSMTNTILPNPFNTGTGWTLPAPLTGDQLDGEYTCGLIAAFGTVKTFYAITAVGTPGTWNVNTTWSNTSSTGPQDVAAGAVAGTNFPGPNNPVIVGDASNARGVVIDANSRSCGSLSIGATSIVDCSTFVGLTFGTNTSGAIAGTGTLRIAAIGAGVSTMFPAGDFTNFLGPNGGTVEWYGATKTIPATGPAPQNISLANYYNLVLNPSAANTITLPPSNLTIYNNLTSGTVTTFTGTAATNGARTISIANFFKVNAGTFNLSNGGATALTASGDITIDGTLAVIAGGTTHTITTTGNIANSGTMTLRNTSFANLIFTGTNNVTFSGAGATTLNLVTVNKGTSQTPTVTCSLSGTLTTTAAAAGWLTLSNGTFDYEYTGASLTYPTGGFTISSLSTSSYTIPSTAKLKVGAGSIAITNASGGANDFFLNGTLEVSGGTVYTQTTAANGSDNDIEYAAAGTPSIIISSGSLSVDGSIRRSTSTITGALVYSQTGGTVTVGGNASNATRGIFEIDYNAGSSFTLTGASTLTVQRFTNGTGYADVFINPVTSNVSPTSTIAVGLTTATTQNNLRVNIAPSIGNFTVQGPGAGANPQTVNLFSNPMVLGGNLAITTPSILNTNNLDVSIAGNLSCPGTGTSTYNGGTNTTTFNGTTNQTAVLTSTSTFTNITVNNTGGAGNKTVQIVNTSTAPNLTNLNILNGVLDVNGLSLTVSGNITNNSSQINTGAATGSINFSGASATHTITSSNGSFNNLSLGVAAAAPVTKTITVNGNMTMTGILDFTTFGTNRYLFIGSNLLSFGTGATISNAGTTRFIKTNGVSSDLGVLKNWSGATTNFTYAVGTRTNYTPVSMGTTTALTVTTPGSYTVVPVDAAHPTSSPTGPQILDYYWKVTKDNALIHNSTGSLIFQVPTSLIGGSGGALIGSYLNAISLVGWTAATAPDGISVVGGNTLLTFNNNDLNTVMPGVNGEFDYTYGTTTTLPNPITPVYSRFGDTAPTQTTNVGVIGTGGSWANATSWTLSSTGWGAALSSVPTNRPVVILPVSVVDNHPIARINLDILGQSAFTTQLSGLLVVSTPGHNIGSISSTGTMRTTTSTLPAGTYTTFTTAGGGTIEYAAPITMNSRTTYNNLLISSSSVTTTASNLTINGNLTVAAASSLDNSISGAKVTMGIAGNFSNSGTFSAGGGTTGIDINLAGNWTNSGTFNGGTSTVTFNGTAAQTITGSTTFNNLTINNTFGTTPQITLSGSDEVVSSTLTMTKGNINLNARTLTIGTSAASTGTLSHSLVSTSGWMYGGNLTRYFNTTTISDGTVGGLFPMGTSTDFRPFFVGIPSAMTTGGTFTLSNNTSAITNPVSILDANPAATVFLQHQAAWSVSSSGVVGGTYDLTAGGTGFGTIGNLADLRLTKSASVVGTNAPATNTTSDPRLNRTGLTLTDITTTGGNQFFVGSTNTSTSPLPIELISFTGDAKKYGVDLQWKTASETNSDYFTVLRSASGANFESVGTVKGNGTTNSSHSYLLTDSKPFLGKNYYQLKQTDFDGRSTSSETIVVDVLSLEPLVSIYPNPLSQNQTMNVVINGLEANSPTEIQIVNVQGSKVNGATVNTDSDGSLNVSIALTGLSSGLYILKVQNVRYKFIIE